MTLILVDYTKMDEPKNWPSIIVEGIIKFETRNKIAE